MSEAVTVKLKHPYTFGGEEIKELTIVRPKAKHLKGIVFKKDEGIKVEDLLVLAANLSGYPPSALDDLEIDDFEAVGVAVGNFMENSQKT
ncbi:MAG: phage tail assembly protein [Desulfobacterales bacterium]|nr:phage tail assembly protein [Desulfobacterales bacterium]